MPQIPSPAPHPLSADEVAPYHRDGFLVEDDVFTGAEVTAWRAAIADLGLDRADRVGQRTMHHLCLTAEHPCFRDLARDPRITRRLAGLLGPDIVLQHAKLAAKPQIKGMGPFAWHQDFAYYPHTNTTLASVMVMVDDATPENGCMEMVPGSHRLGLLDHADDDGFFTGCCQRSELWSAQGTTVAITPRAGGISIHHTLTLHGSGPNRSGLPRRGLVFSYRAADAHQLADQIFPDTGTVVLGTSSGVVRCEAAVLRLPRFRGRSGLARYGSAWHQVGDQAAAWNREAGFDATGGRFVAED